MSSTESPPPGAAPPPAMDEATARAFERWSERVNTLTGTLPFLNAVVANHEQMKASVAEMEQDLKATREALSKGDISTEVQEDITQLEGDVLQLDDATPDGFVRKAVAASPPDSTLDYCRVLASHLTPLRMDRVVSIMAQLCTASNGTVKPFAEAKDFLLGLGITSDVTLETLGAAVRFFESAAQRLQTTETLDAVFSSGFFMDVYGYRISLRDQLLEPEVLYAFLQMENALMPRMRLLSSQVGLSAELLEKRITAARDEVDQVFKVARRLANAPDSFVRRRRPKDKGKKVAATKAPASGRSAGTTPAQQLLALVLAAGIPLLILLGTGFLDTNLKTITAADLQGISKVLESGGVSKKGSPMVFIGKVDANTWMGLQKPQKQLEAEKMALVLTQRGVRHGVVTAGDAVAVQIEDGRAVLVR